MERHLAVPFKYIRKKAELDSINTADWSEDQIAALQALKDANQAEIDKFGVQEMPPQMEAAYLEARIRGAAESVANKRIADAKKALEKTDIVYLRCAKAGVEFNQAWMDYTTLLRAVVKGQSEILPEEPENYPPGSN